MSLRPSWGFILMMGAALLFFLYTKLSHLSLRDVRSWALHRLYGVELVTATLALALTVVIIWQGHRFARMREKGRGAVVVADMDLGKIAGLVTMKVPISLTLDDLRHHAHFLGATGSGKTVTLENVFRGFVLNRRTAGVFVDPKDGKAIRSLMHTLPDSTKDRVVLIRPDDDKVVGLNPLEVMPGESEELVADQAVAILRRVLRRTGGDNAWGGRMDVVASIAVRTLMKHPGSTLCDLPTLLGPDPTARARWTHGLKDPFVLEPFWASYDPKGRGVDAVVARLQGLLARPSIRAMLGQPRSTINLGKLLDTGSIVLVDIPKGRIGEDAMALLGSFLVARLWQVTQRRADDANPRPVCVVLDEFQNFVDEHLTEVLTESRAYNVGWLLANQFQHQLPTSVQHAVESCALTKMRLTGSDDRRVFHAQLRRRLFPDQEVAVVLRPPATGLGAGHAEALADHSLRRHGTPRSEVEDYLLQRLGRRLKAGQTTVADDQAEYADHWA